MGPIAALKERLGRCGCQAEEQRAGADDRKIVLVGSPNVGKSVIFGRLTGRYVTVSNYPGTTVELTTPSHFSWGSSSASRSTPWGLPYEMCFLRSRIQRGGCPEGVRGLRYRLIVRPYPLSGVRRRDAERSELVEAHKNDKNMEGEKT